MIRKIGLFVVAAAGLACNQNLAGPTSDQALPADIHKIAIRPVINKTQQFGLEDALAPAIRDEFLHDGRCSIVPEKDADGLVMLTLTRYTVLPIQYDSNLNPTGYKLTIYADLQFLDRAKNIMLWTEKDMPGIQVYPAQNLSGGMSEGQAQALIWDNLSRDVVARVIDGFSAPVVAPVH